MSSGSYLRNESASYQAFDQASRPSLPPPPLPPPPFPPMALAVSAHSGPSTMGPTSFDIENPATFTPVSQHASYPQAHHRTPSQSESQPYPTHNPSLATSVPPSDYPRKKQRTQYDQEYYTRPTLPQPSTASYPYGSNLDRGAKMAPPTPLLQTAGSIVVYEPGPRDWKTEPQHGRSPSIPATAGPDQGFAYPSGTPYQPAAFANPSGFATAPLPSVGSDRFVQGGYALPNPVHGPGNSLEHQQEQTPQSAPPAPVSHRPSSQHYYPHQTSTFAQSSFSPSLPQGLPPMSVPSSSSQTGVSSLANAGSGILSHSSYPSGGPGLAGSLPHHPGYHMNHQQEQQHGHPNQGPGSYGNNWAAQYSTTPSYGLPVSGQRTSITAPDSPQTGSYYGPGPARPMTVPPMEDLERTRSHKSSEEGSSMASPVIYQSVRGHEAASAQTHSGAATSSSGRGEEHSSTGKSGRKQKRGPDRGTGKNQPVFVTKLFNMLEDPEIRRSGLLKWSDDGGGFICTDPQEFAKLILPQYFKHNNFHSFVRQLNMYGFSKQVNDVFLTLTSPNQQSSPWEFRHATFRRDDPEGIASIKRRSVKQTNQLRLQMEAEVAARQAAQRGSFPGPLGFSATPLTPSMRAGMGMRPPTMSPAPGMPQHYVVHRQGYPLEASGPTMYPMPASYPPEMAGRPGQGSHMSSYAPPPNQAYINHPNSYSNYRPAPPTSGSTYSSYLPSSGGSAAYAYPISASYSTQPPSYYTAQSPIVGRGGNVHGSDPHAVRAMARQAGYIEEQATHLVQEQEALKQESEEIRQETGVILSSLSGNQHMNHSLAGTQALQLREDIERLHQKASMKEKRLSASLASVETIAANAHALQDSLAAAAISTSNPVEGLGIRTMVEPNWQPKFDVLPPMQQKYEQGEHYPKRNENVFAYKVEPSSREDGHTRRYSAESGSSGERRSGSGSGGIKELLN